MEKIKYFKLFVIVYLINCPLNDFAQSNSINTVHTAVGKTTHCEFSMDGTLASACSIPAEIAGSLTTSLVIIDVKTQTVLQDLPINAMFATFSPDNTKLLYWDLDSGLVERNIATGKTKQLIENKRELAVYRGKYSPDGKQIALACFDGKIKLINTADNKTTFTLLSNKNNKRCANVAYMADSSLVSIGDNNVIVWNALTGKEIRNFEKAKSTGLQAAIATADNKAILCYDDRTYSYNTHTGDVKDLGAQGGYYCGGISADGSIYLMSIQRSNMNGVLSFKGDGTSGGKNGIGIPNVQWIDFSRDGKNIILTSEREVVIADYQFFKNIAERKE